MDLESAACASWCGVALALLALWVVYKVLDHVIRWPRVGGRADRYILVTGCSTGFGYEAVRRLDRLGCHVFAGVRTEKAETELRKVCSERVITVQLDVTKPDSVRKAFEAVVSSLPKDRGLWGVVSNAGVIGRLGRCEWCTIEDYKQVCAVNLFGMIDVTMTFLPLVKKSRGRIVLVGSVGGRHCMTSAMPYSVSKYGLEAFGDGLRRSLHPYGCKVSLVEPGGYATPMVTKAPSDVVDSWQRVSDETRLEFGQEYFDYIDRETELYSTRLASLRIDDVAATYEQALFDRFPRARYLVGLDAKYLFMPVQWLPESLGDLVLRLASFDRPLPTALKRQRT